MQLGQFHSADYIDLLSVVTPDNQAEHSAAMQRHNFNEDCPVFDGLFEYCRWVCRLSCAAAAAAVCCWCCFFRTDMWRWFYNTGCPGWAGSGVLQWVRII
jgi:acetoin utilization deacetylase AcuC-like enzyme